MPAQKKSQKKPTTKRPRHVKQSRKSHLYDFFIPHHGNNHAPHILHPKRALLYGTIATGAKMIVITATALMPLEAFLAPDVLAEQQRKLVALVNETRADHELAPLADAPILQSSSQAKAQDMAKHDYFAHDGPDGRNFKYFLSQAGYEYHLAGENLAMGFSDARAVVNAWIKSPLHYRNIIEPDFKEMGMSLAMGMHDGEETIYIANHFGDPIIQPAITTQPSEPEPAPAPQPEPQTQQQALAPPSPAKPQTAIASQTENAPEPKPVAQKPSFTYVSEGSHVRWEYSNGATTLNVQAYIEGRVAQAHATVDEYTIPLTANNAEANLYTGSLTVQRPINDFFKVILAPSIEITGTNGMSELATIPWYQIKVAEQTPLTRYENTKNWMPSFATLLFATEQGFYVFMLVFFIAALAINVLIEVRTQRPHVIIPTLVLVVLVGMLWWL